MAGYDEEDGSLDIAHPADVVPSVLAVANPDNRQVNLTSLEGWYAGYAQKRGLHHSLFKPAGSFAGGSFDCEASYV